jgi:hypothetical protein
MLQRALPLHHPQVALGQKLGAHAPSDARTFGRAFVGQLLRFWRLLERFAVAGGPLS